VLVVAPKTLTMSIQIIVIFNGVEKVVKFNVEVVTAGLVLEGGLLALSDYFNDNPTQVENEDNIIDDATPLQG
jgi:hypothetical protein